MQDNLHIKLSTLPSQLGRLISLAFLGGTPSLTEAPAGSQTHALTAPLNIRASKMPIGAECISICSAGSTFQYLSKHAAAVQHTSELAEKEKKLLTVERRVNADRDR